MNAIQKLSLVLLILFTISLCLLNDHDDDYEPIVSHLHATVAGLHSCVLYAAERLEIIDSQM